MHSYNDFDSLDRAALSAIERQLTHVTSNKQFAFLPHIYRSLKPGGRAAVVLPDNVLFESNVGTDIRRDLMDKCNLHTILRLPTGIFYAQGDNLDISWLKGDSTEAADAQRDEPALVARLALRELNAAIADLRALLDELGEDPDLALDDLLPDAEDSDSGVAA